MDPSSSVAVLATGAGSVSAADPHLLVLGLLVGAWLLDLAFAALERLGRADAEGDDDPPGPPVEAGGPGDASRPSGAE